MGNRLTHISTFHRTFGTLYLTHDTEERRSWGQITPQPIELPIHTALPKAVKGTAAGPSQLPTQECPSCLPPV